MRRTAILLAISLISAVPLAAQTTEFGVLFGGSKRVIKTHEAVPGTVLQDPSFKFSNSSIDLYYAVQIDPGAMFKMQVGRIDGPIAIREVAPDGTQLRRDVDGEVQHAEGVVEYRFSEAFGSTGLFAGVGVYRHQASGFDSRTDYGFPIGLTSDFPLSRRYGLIVGATYHFTNADFRPRYFTLSGGLRLGF